MRAGSAEARSGLAPWALAELPEPPTPRGLGWLSVVGPGVIVLGLSMMMRGGRENRWSGPARWRL